jgi:hypothetical protein
VLDVRTRALCSEPGAFEGDGPVATLLDEEPDRARAELREGVDAVNRLAERHHLSAGEKPIERLEVFIVGPRHRPGQFVHARRQLPGWARRRWAL